MIGDQVVENRALRRIFGFKRRKVAVGGRQLQNEELNVFRRTLLI
jgi:hypothetical protein